MEFGLAIAVTCFGFVLWRLLRRIERLERQAR